MRFFKKGHKFDHTDMSVNQHNKKLKGAASDAAAQTLFHDHFANAEMFGEFKKEVFVPLDVLQLLESGVIDYVHQDNCYIEAEIIETDEDGTVLCLPVLPMLNYKQFREVCEKALAAKTEK